jgi:hypothetical protein
MIIGSFTLAASRAPLLNKRNVHRGERHDAESSVISAEPPNGLSLRGSPWLAV